MCAQGGSVISHLVRSDKPYQLRAFTRDASKPSSKELEKKGVKVVQGDFSNSTDLERAFQGADIVFANVIPNVEHLGDEKGF